MTPALNHNIEPGPVTSCQVCGSHDLELIIDLGHQPLCDSLPTRAQLNEPETCYPLRLLRCLNCSLAQCDYVVDNATVFHRDYPYRSGITRQVVEHSNALARHTVNHFNIPKDSLIVDIGSNDGTLLAGFKQLGLRVLGVEPTDIAKIAREENNIDTIHDFFTEQLAQEIRRQYGAATAVTATNVFAHVTALGDVLRGVATLLDQGGLFITESHYLGEIVRLAQYDSIYHEHLRSYSLKSLVCLFEQYDFTVVDAQYIDRYCGSIRVCAVKGGGAPANASVRAILDREKAAGLYEKKTYDVFRDTVLRARDDLLRLALRARNQGQLFVGNSCPGRGSTLVNYTGLTPDLMPYICEQPTSLKLGKHLPGKHIPIVENSRLLDDQPDLILLLAWHYADAIAKELRARGVRAKLLVPLPAVRVLDV